MAGLFFHLLALLGSHASAQSLIALPRPAAAVAAAPEAAIALPGEPAYEAAVSAFLRPEPSGRPLEESLLAPRRPEASLREFSTALRSSPGPRLDSLFEGRRSRVYLPGEPSPEWERGTDDSAWRLA